MSDKSLLFLKAFLENVEPAKKETLLQFLSPASIKKISALPASSCDLTSLSSSFEKRMKTIHPSWFMASLKKLKNHDLRYFSSCFTQEQYAWLAQHFSLEKEHLLPHFAKLFLSQILMKKIDDKEILPLECLPASSLNELLSLHFHQLDEMIDLLSMHDLSAEIKMIIDPNILKQLDKCLSKTQRSYLKSLLQKKERLVFGKLHLEKWDGHDESLKKMLLSRGINRLAKAFSGESPSLVWHMAHHLDRETGQTFQKLCVGNESETKELLVSQVMHLIPLLKGE